MHVVVNDKVETAEMADISVVNSVVDEDWDAECSSDSPAVSRPVMMMSQDMNAALSGAVQETVALSSDLSAADVTSEAEHCDDRSTCVTDSKKLFVSNVNYRVSLVCSSLCVGLDYCFGTPKKTTLIGINTYNNVSSNDFTFLVIVNVVMWANAQRDGRPAKYRWRPLFNAAKFG